MQRIKVSSHFFLDELVPPSIYSRWGERAMTFVDYRIVLALDHLRDLIDKPIIVNNWINGGQYKESGLREFTTTTGARMSQHKFGRAMDIKVAGMTPKQVHAIILENEKFFIQNQLITTLENADYTKTWTHIDCRFTGLDTIQIVNP
jgi:hypothetical protein